MSHAQRLSRHRTIYVLILFSAPVWLQLSLVSDGWQMLVALTRLAVILFGLVFLVRALRRPVSTKLRFDVAGGAFVTRAGKVQAMLLSLLAMECSGLSLHSRMPVFDWLLIAGCVLIAAVVGLMVWRDLPVLELHPDGIRMPGAAWRDTEIPWTLLRPGFPVRGKLTDQTMPLAYEQPMSLPARLRRHRSLQLTFDVHPWFLADVVRWYVDHPEDRAAIGTQAEHDRLVTALGAV